MGLRVHRSIKILPGVKINLGLRGPSLSVGEPGATVNLGRHGARSTLGVPGTGVSWTSKLGSAGKVVGAIALVLVLVLVKTLAHHR